MDIEDQIRAWATQAGDEIPPWAPDHLQASRHRPAQRRPFLLAAAAAWVAIVGGAAWYVTADHGTDVTVQSAATTSPAGPMIDARHERLEYRVVVVDLTCQNGTTPRGEVSTAPVVYDAWAAAGRWRNEVRYPDGSIRRAVWLDDPTSQNGDVYLDNAEQPIVVGCGDDILTAEPSWLSYVTLNLLGDPPMITVGADTIDGVSAEQATVPARDTYKNGAVRQPDPTTDSRGRVCTIWRRDGSGFNFPGGVQAAASQREDWCVDDAGSVLEYTFTNTVDTIGTVTTIMTLTDTDADPVDEGLFDTNRLTRYSRRTGLPAANASAEPTVPVVTVTTTGGTSEPDNEAPETPGRVGTPPLECAGAIQGATYEYVRSGEAGSGPSDPTAAVRAVLPDEASMTGANAAPLELTIIPHTEGSATVCRRP